MRYEARYLHAERYVLHAVVATLCVVVLPVIVVWTVLAVVDPDPHPLVTSALGLALALGASVLGAAWWMRRPDSTDISFGELMLWSWLRRKRAEERVATGTRLLGVDETGIAVENPLSPQEQLELLKDLTAALESKDPYTHGHTRRVERHAYRTGLALGLHASELEDLRKAALLHDVGKVRVPDRLLRKPSDLTLEERTLVESHVNVGAWMVSNVGNDEIVAGVRHHHERWDGTGYPLGLQGTDIPLLARIISVADAYDAMTSTRPYRPGIGKDPAIEGLRGGSGTQFDPQVVRAFLETLPRPLAVPLAGLFLIFAGPSRFIRRVAVNLKQAGASALAAAAGAAGAVAVLSAGLVGLAPPAQGVTPERAVAAPAADVQAPVLPPTRRAGPDSPIQLRPTRDTRAPQVLGVRFSNPASDIGSQASPPGNPGNPQENLPPSGGEPPPGNQSTPTEGPPPSPNPSPPSPDETPPEDPPPGDAGSEEPAPSGDSQDDEGKKGKGHDKGRGEGHEDHEGEGESDGNSSDEDPEPDDGGSGGGQP